jgi:dephospho-CoA kinase
MTPIRFVLGGGIGSGKSTAAAAFGRFGAHLVVADDVARSVLAPGSSAVAAVAELWPTTVSEGILDRQALGRIVFSDPEALAAIEAITHPETAARIIAETETEAAAARDIVVEMPILRDWLPGWPVVVVDAPREVRIARVVGRGRGPGTVSEVESVMANQPSRAEWLAAADYVIDNSGDRAHLDDQCRRVWERLERH